MCSDGKSKFDEAFEIYSEIYSKNKLDFEIWKYFYFFVWIAIEDAPNSFHEKIKISKLLQELFIEGQNNFKDNSEFNFIAGWTASIFPYEYGEFDDMEKEGQKMLHYATLLEPENEIYKMVYLASISDNDDYRKSTVKAAPKVLETYSGNGSLNKYFRQVLYRVNKTSY